MTVHCSAMMKVGPRAPMLADTRAVQKEKQTVALRELLKGLLKEKKRGKLWDQWMVAKRVETMVGLRAP